MAKKKPEITSAPPTPSGSDDFKLIKGIGPSIEQRLHNADILTFAQLATLSPEDIAEVLGNHPLLSAEHIVKEDWIGQASKLASQAASAPFSEPGTPRVRQRHAYFSVELSFDEDGHVQRAHVFRHEDGHKGDWDGWDDKQLADFIKHRALDWLSREQVPSSEAKTIAERPLAVSATEVPATLPSAEQEPPAALKLEVADVSVAQVPAQEQGAVQALPKRLRAQVNFRLSGAAADQVTANESPYAIQALACELATGQTMVLATAHEQLRLGVLAYTPAVEFAPPPAGRYQLMALVLLPHDNAARAGLGPVLRIVPE